MCPENQLPQLTYLHLWYCCYYHLPIFEIGMPKLFGGQIRTIVTPHTYLSKHGLAINHDCFRHISNYHAWLFKKGRNQWSLSLTWDKSIALVKTHYLNPHYSRYTWFYLKTCNEIATYVLCGYYMRIMANVLAPWIFR